MTRLNELSAMSSDIGFVSMATNDPMENGNSHICFFNQYLNFKYISNDSYNAFLID